jgi:hypothetical protein
MWRSVLDDSNIPYAVNWNERHGYSWFRINVNERLEVKVTALRLDSTEIEVPTHFTL